jgi:murein endopeptidase
VARRWTWLAVLGLLAALVPLAAFASEGSDRAVAVAAPTSALPLFAEGPPVDGPVVGVAEDVTPRVVWRDSLALGTPNNGRLVNGVQLPVRGTGYYTYNPDTQRPPGGPDRRWGTATTIHRILDLGAWWAATHPAAPRLGIGDIALKGGGPFTSDHASHQNGLDVDIRLVRRDGVEGQANPANYDRGLTQEVVDRLVAEGATMVLIGPSLDLSCSVCLRWPNHDDHLHVRFPDPDGTAN